MISLSRGSKRTQGALHQTRLETQMNLLCVARPGPQACPLSPITQRPPEPQRGGNLRVFVPGPGESHGPVVPVVPATLVNCLIFDSALPLVQRPFSSRLVRACNFRGPHLYHLLPLRQSLLELNSYRISIWSKLGSEVVASLDYTNGFLAFT